jgi:hypothetical protein
MYIKTNLDGKAGWVNNVQVEKFGIIWQHAHTHSPYYDTPI